MKEIVAKIEQARRDGVDITADTYGYPAWFNSFSAFIPPWAHDGGDEKLHRAAEGSGDARADQEGHALARRQGVGQRVAGDSRARSGADRRRAEPTS